MFFLRRIGEITDNFWDKVCISSGCWLFLYGMIWFLDLNNDLLYTKTVKIVNYNGSKWKKKCLSGLFHKGYKVVTPIII